MDLATRLEQLYTGAVYDVLRAKGYTDCALPSTIRILDPGEKIAGEVFTMSGRPAPEADAHETLLAWTGFLSKAPSGSVVVCQPNDSEVAHMGELSAETLKLRGVRGYIVDGGCRDTDFIRRIGFNVCCRYLTPRDVVGYWVPEEFGEPVVIGGVTINTGDYVVADCDGVVVIPRDLAEEVTADAEAVLRTENLVRKAILEGTDPQDAYLRHGAF